MEEYQRDSCIVITKNSKSVVNWNRLNIKLVYLQIVYLSYYYLENADRSLSARSMTSEFTLKELGELNIRKSTPVPFK